MTTKPPMNKATKRATGVSKSRGLKKITLPVGSTLEVADEPALQSTRWCTHCFVPRTPIGGMWMIMQGGKTRRWLCMTCAARHRPSKVV